MNVLSGILPLYKPAGFTSHDCVMKIRKLARTKKSRAYRHIGSRCDRCPPDLYRPGNQGCGLFA